MDPLSGPESFLKQPWRSFISTLYRAMWPFCRLMSSAGLPMLASCRTRTSTIPSSIGFSTSLINTGTLSPCPEKRYASISLTVNILSRFLRWEPFGLYMSVRSELYSKGDTFPIACLLSCLQNKKLLFLLSPVTRMGGRSCGLYTISPSNGVYRSFFSPYFFACRKKHWNNLLPPLSPIPSTLYVSFDSSFATPTLPS